MFADDSVADGKAETGALADWFGGEEGVEDSIADLGLHTAAGVGDFDSYSHRPGLGPGANGHAAFRRAGVDGIHEEVDDHLVHTRASAADGRQRLELGGEANAAFASVALHHVHRRFDAGVQVDFVPVALVDTGEEPQVFHDPLDPPQALSRAVDELGKIVQSVVQVELFADLVDAAERRLFFRIIGPLECAIKTDQGDQVFQIALEHDHVVADEGERIVYFVGHAGDELAQAGELFGLYQAALSSLQVFVCLSFGFGQFLEGDVLLFQQLFGAHPLGDVPEDPLDADWPPVRAEKGRFHDLDVELFATRGHVLFDDVDELTMLEHVLVVLAIFFGELFGEEVEVGLSLDFLESAAELGAEFLVSERESAFKVLAKDHLGDRFDE